MAAPADRPPTLARVGMAIGVGVVLVLGLVVAAIRPNWQVDPIVINLPSARPRQPPQLPHVSQSGTPSMRPLPPPGQPPDLSWIKWVLLALVIAALVVLLGVIAMRLLAVRQMYAARPDDEIEVTDDVLPDLPTLQQGAVTAEQRLLAIGNPTDAIIAAWLALEEAADASGVHRRPAQTPTEFTADVLGRTGVPTEPVRTLLGLYLRARFAATPSSADDLATARRCVRDLADSWQSFARTEPTQDRS
ncbi:DUF4129 domain-containing protein [Microlunatus sp. Gsoil 973]|uniref:DUF4129 domain-containing protein n=1 Tax=Microlunatus sp. Gsoil 973 TaxID=2672569 RepID=UPI0012B4941C|nr:DUF4129 domain-containing protein [Microlunatus sp. Gsoil 973]QGN31850.1 DUF4129 domain-containing protein [Microlunatus sp. Gsoil 973]